MSELKSDPKAIKKEPELFPLPAIKNKPVTVDFSAPDLSSMGGLSILIFFNEYYGEYCYMPLFLFEGHSGKLILPLLRPGRINKRVNVYTLIKHIMKRLRSGRGVCELDIKEVKTYLHDDRMSCHSFLSNHFRLFLYCAAYVVLHNVKSTYFEGTCYESATIQTFRTKVLLSACHIKELKGSIKIQLSENNPATQNSAS